MELSIPLHLTQCHFDIGPGSGMKSSCKLTSSLLLAHNIPQWYFVSIDILCEAPKTSPLLDLLHNRNESLFAPGSGMPCKRHCTTGAVNTTMIKSDCQKGFSLAPC